MTKLKTLKDIEKEAGNPIYMYNMGFLDCMKVLRQEAIKWIKELRSGTGFEGEFYTDDYPICEWIKYFFNITEEDLK